MNRAKCQKLIDSYVDWLHQGLSLGEVGDACELTTPFLDRHNDHLQVYATRRNGNIVLSNDGYILSDLRTSGLRRPKDQRLSQHLGRSIPDLAAQHDDGRPGKLVKRVAAACGGRFGRGAVRVRKSF